MRKNELLGIGLLVLMSCAGHAPGSTQVPGKPQEAPVLLVGGDIYTVSGDIIPGGQVLFDKGKIVAVGTDLKAPEGAKRMDVSGKRVYPGLLSAGTDLGLAEISSVRGSIDRGESGQINPNARAEVAVNPDSEWIPVARANGVLLNLTVPNGGVLTGSSAVLQLDGWTWEEMTVKAPVAVHLAWPRMAPVRGWEEEEAPEAQTRRRDEQLKVIDQAFMDARAYLASKKATTQPGDRKADFDARWEAMIPLLEGRVPLVVDADEVRQIQAAVAFAAKEKLKLILLGGYDAPLCADLLKKHDVPVIVGGVHRLPMRRDASPDEPFTLPERLRQAGIRYCISHSGRFGGSNVRNLPYHAGTAAAHGLPQDEALKAITLYPAQILSVDDRVGSIAEGKDATLFVADGDILETPTKVEMAFVQGRQIDLSSRHTALWEKYRSKYGPGRFTDHGARAP